MSPVFRKVVSVSLRKKIIIGYLTLPDMSAYAELMILD